MNETAQLTIRQAHPTDLEPLVELYEQLATETAFLTDDQVNKSKTKRTYQMTQQIDQYSRSLTSIMLVVELQEEIIALGTLATLPGSRQSHVAEVGIGVLKDYWGNGIASILLEELLYFAKETALKVITLEVVQENKRAIALYKKFGFKIVGSLSQRLQADQIYYDTYMMEYLL
ncbi:GNAT family N-acetyltransferase [Dolosicoccus paucivorans]